MVEEKIINFLSNFISEDLLERETDIFESGYVNSLFVMQLILYIEEEFDIRVENKDMSPRYFNTVVNIVNFIQSKLETQKSEVK